MSRIRTVKPEFFTHPKVQAVSLPARLLLIALWTDADDDGRLYDQPRRIGALAFADNDAIDEDATLQELAEGGLIVRYEVHGRRLIQVHDFRDHQRIDKPRASVLPAPPGRKRRERSTTAPADALRAIEERSTNPPGAIPGGMEGNGKERKGSGREGIKDVGAAQIATRRRDECWEVFLEVTGVEGDRLSTERRKALNGMLAAIKRAGASPEEIRRRAENWPFEVPLTPEGLTKRWAELGRPRTTNTRPRTGVQQALAEANRLRSEGR